MEESLKKLIDTLRELGGLCHVTSVQNYRKIRDSGLIKANDGKSPFNWGNYQCSELGAISLFDFQTPELGDLYDDFIVGKWRSIITMHWPIAVFLVLAREQLPIKPLGYYEVKQRGCSGNMVPHGIEVCYPGNISLQYVSQHLVAFIYGAVRDHDVFNDRVLSDSKLRQLRSDHKNRAEQIIKSRPDPTDIDREILLEKIYREKVKKMPMSVEEVEQFKVAIKQKRIRDELSDLRKATRW